MFTSNNLAPQRSRLPVKTTTLAANRAQHPLPEGMRIKKVALKPFSDRNPIAIGNPIAEDPLFQNMECSTNQVVDLLLTVVAALVDRDLKHQARCSRSPTARRAGETASVQCVLSWVRHLGTAVAFPCHVSLTRALMCCGPRHGSSTVELFRAESL